ncbi:hypothetical protein DPMN_038425 [Dreissena polymorpha]|uniref:Dipeptidylpeptidase IV N-terminal domain-containing protein n=1 Tax=Dreissena polymorpha TaxID=45954 RepID=A0A9D4RQQ6_DREPO|nr:hypothetical protein DPMN_038425 [Dreissena polymorpha]
MFHSYPWYGNGLCVLYYRLGVYGITSFEVTDERRLLFPAGNALYTCTDSNLASTIPIVPEPIPTEVQGARMDPKSCPSNPNIVAFVRSNDLWVCNVDTKQELRLTFTNKGTGDVRQDWVSSGVPSFVVQEEFDRYTGYWWDPVCRDGRTYRILYEEVNESEVDIIQFSRCLLLAWLFSEKTRGIVIASSSSDYRYPRAGKTNADSCLKMAQFTVGNDGRFEDEVIMLRLFEPLSSLSVDSEYLARAGWTPDGNFVHCQMLNRVQTNLTLYLIPRECFVTEARYQPSSQTRTDAQYEPVPLPPVHVLLEETSDIWVNITDILHFLPARPDSRDRSGYRHLYRITTGDWEASSKEKPILPIHPILGDMNRLLPFQVDNDPLSFNYPSSLFSDMGGRNTRSGLLPWTKGHST